MGQLDTTAFDAVLKFDYEKYIVDELNENTRMLNLFSRYERLAWEGKVVAYPLRTGRKTGEIPDCGLAYVM